MQKVVDVYTGAHDACKIVAVKSEVPQWRICPDTDFRVRVEKEVNLVQELQYAYIVLYTHTQGFKIGWNIEIFMPTYEGNLYDLLKRLRHEASDMVLAKTGVVLHQMLDSLDFIYTRDLLITHRDINSLNIFTESPSSF
ncbi:hypothetical protein F4779DRAFT_305707 [Xylariaceae sp. FL0662B]|nr:hypothetical protein F4779DRAFT_305707 [Xylariaceae sp. FL0662B]